MKRVLNLILFLLVVPHSAFAGDYEFAWSEAFRICGSANNASIFVSDDKKFHRVICKEGAKKLESYEATNYFSQVIKSCVQSKKDACLDNAMFYTALGKTILNISMSQDDSSKEIPREQLREKASRKMATYLINLNPRAAKLVGREDYIKLTDFPYDQSEIIIGLTMISGNQKYIGYASMNPQNQVYEWVEENATATPFEIYEYGCAFKNIGCKQSIESGR